MRHEGCVLVMGSVLLQGEAPEWEPFPSHLSSLLYLSLYLWLSPCHVKVQSEGCYPQARKRILIRNWTCWHLDLRFVASKTEKVNVCCLSLPSLWYYIVAVPLCLIWLRLSAFPTIFLFFLFQEQEIRTKCKGCRMTVTPPGSQWARENGV